MNNFQATIGIEVHAELNTNSKMFSAAAVSFIDQPNTNINEIDLGLPGILPSPNKAAVIKAIQLATALKMKIDPILCFDRKNYFYPDLPKGFQITQQYHPIGKEGSITISNKDIRIERIHLEEDTAKQQIINGELCLDYNRCGIPLIEIVSQPDITTSKEAIEYLNELKRILIFLNISDGKMEEGSFRADVNISVNLIGAKNLGTKVEIKNINSFANVASAIEYEYQRQIRQILKNIPVVQETRRWDDKMNKTIFMRLKLDNVDYHYFREPNIIQLDISHLIKNAQNQMLELPSSIKQKMWADKIQPNLINQLLDNYDAYKVYKYVNDKINNSNLVTTWIIVELGFLLKKNNGTYQTLNKVFLNNSICLLKLLLEEKINNKQGKVIFAKMYETNKTPDILIKELGFVQITDNKIIENYLKEYLIKNPEMIKQYKNRPERVTKFFIGLLMRDTKGQANPIVASEILKKLLS